MPGRLAVLEEFSLLAWFYKTSAQSHHLFIHTSLSTTSSTQHQPIHRNKTLFFFLMPLTCFNIMLGLEGDGMLVGTTDLLLLEHQLGS